MREVLAGKLERKKLRRGGTGRSSRVKSATLDRHHERRSHSSMSGRVARLSGSVLAAFSI